MNDNQQKCMEKLTWSTEEEARAAAIYANLQHGEGKPHPYKCRICGKWHLSNRK